MKKTIIILIAFLIVSFACKSSIKNDSNSSTFIYEDSLVDEKLLAWHFAVNSPEGKIYADSAIAVIDSMISRYSADSQKQLKYILQKMNFLILKKEYEEAISVMSRSSDKLWNFGGEYFKDIFKYRILAMKAKEANNDTEYKDALKNALSLVKKYISNNQKKYDACIAVELSNQRGKYIIVTYQYVFYHFLLYGKETTDKLIESMRIKYNLHRDVIELLRNEYFAKISQNIVRSRGENGKYTNVARGEFFPWQASFDNPMQFIGTYRYDGYSSKNGRNINNVATDSKSITSLVYHIPFFKNHRRSLNKHLGTTYQFYIWRSKK